MRSTYYHNSNLYNSSLFMYKFRDVKERSNWNLSLRLDGAEKHYVYVSFMFFFFLKKSASRALWVRARRESKIMLFYGSHALFTGPTSTLFKKKKKSYNTIHTFKNYFVTVFSVFSKINSIQTHPKCQQMKNPAPSKLASRHFMDKCQLKRNEANFCSILEACSHPKLLTHLYIDVSCTWSCNIWKRNKNCNEIEFLQYSVFFHI